MLVYRRQRQQRRNCDVFAIDFAVGNDQDRITAAYRVFRLGAQRCEPCFYGVLAPRDRIADIEFARPELALRIAIDVADLLHFKEIEHRLADFQPQRRVQFVDAQQIGLRSDEGNQRGHEFFAYRVDRRVGDLREQLLEIVVQRFVFVRQHRQRRVVAHRADRLLAVDRHRRHQELDVFLGIGERLLTVEQGHGRTLRTLLVALDFIEFHADALDPLAVGLRVGERVFEFIVVDDAAFLEVDEKHFAGLQAPLLDDGFLGYGQAAALRAHDDEIVVSHDVARGTQPVAIQRGADLAAVGKDDCCRTIPRLHHRRVVFVKRPPIGVHQGVAFPRFGDHHHDGMRNRIAAHHQEFERIVERRRIGLAVVNQRPQLV